ncbi:hypothetical protein Mal64_12090 [Pseudobythopirellula maris]|uniref:Uncharacterized protein n=1 Tax=Pseudobythopirellula maris TaxID=2527991 RepID=A0A5C5ZTH9_9BACT|nr:hypothetical protein [Pseudobythopirellula maris]TWT90812.1 hypothetical protein Mal64_12090 [Pseudobythopirellula maris]
MAKTASKKVASKKPVKKRVKRGRKPGAPNMSEAAREYLRENPSAGPKEVCEAVEKKTGMKLAPALVSNVKARMFGKKPGGKRGPKKSSGGGADQVSLSALLDARDFAAKCGGVDQAVAVLKTLDKLS